VRVSGAGTAATVSGVFGAYGLRSPTIPGVAPVFAMPTTHTLIAFVVVSATLMVLPGPSNFFILAYGVGRGRGAALRAVAGIETAAGLRVLLTAVGLSAVLASSAFAFAVIRWAGVGYFLYLGARALRSGRAKASVSARRAGSTWRSFGKGFSVGLSNPKTLLFFVAFFPQFVQPGRGSAATQMLFLGLIYVCIAAVWDLSFALASGAIGSWLHPRPHVGAFAGRAEATAYIGLAAYTAAVGDPPRR
jgi:threonine/homoserine/homoserine lactone efflux protein